MIEWRKCISVGGPTRLIQPQGIRRGPDTWSGRVQQQIVRPGRQDVGDRPEASGRIVLETRHVSRVYEGKTLVDDISVSVRRGEVLAVIGASGAGKSSFLRLLNRLDEPTGGAVLLDGADYRGIEPSGLRRRVGMV